VTRGKCFEPHLVTTIPGKELRTEGCGIKIAGHVNRDFSGERGRISEKEIYAGNITPPSKVA
jgi:hypothetical protein